MYHIIVCLLLAAYSNVYCTEITPPLSSNVGLQTQDTQWLIECAQEAFKNKQYLVTLGYLVKMQNVDGSAVLRKLEEYRKEISVKCHSAPYVAYKNYLAFIGARYCEAFQQSLFRELPSSEVLR